MTFRNHVLDLLPFGNWSRHDLAEAITELHDAEIADLQRKGDALASAAGDYLLDCQCNADQTTLGEALNAWRGNAKVGGEPLDALLGHEKRRGM